VFDELVEELKLFVAAILANQFQSFVQHVVGVFLVLDEIVVYLAVVLHVPRLLNQAVEFRVHVSLNGNLNLKFGVEGILTVESQVFVRPSVSFDLVNVFALLEVLNNP
jgi:hypothetical protein